MTLGSLALLEPRLGAVSNVGSLVLSIPAVIVCLRALTLYHRVRRRVNVVIQSYTYLLLSDLVLGVLYVFSSVHDLVVSDIGRGLNPWWCKARAFVFVTAWVSQAVSLLSMSLMLRKLVAQQHGAGRGRQLPLLGSALGWGLGLLVSSGALGSGHLGNTRGLMCFCHEKGEHLLTLVVLSGISGCLVFVCFNYIYACWRLRSVWQRSASVRSSLVSPSVSSFEGPPQSPTSPTAGVLEDVGGPGGRDEEKGNLRGSVHNMASARQLTAAATWGNLTQEGPMYAARAAVIVVRHGLIVVLIFALSYGAMLGGMLWLSARHTGQQETLPVPLVFFTLLALKLQPLLNGCYVLRMLGRVHKRFSTIAPLDPRLAQAIAIAASLETRTTVTEVVEETGNGGGSAHMGLLRALSSQSVAEEEGPKKQAIKPLPLIKPSPRLIPPAPRSPRTPSAGRSEGRSDGPIQMGPHPIHVVHPSASLRLEGLMADLYRRLASTLRASDVFMSASASNNSQTGREFSLRSGGGDEEGSSHLYHREHSSSSSLQHKAWASSGKPALGSPRGFNMRSRSRSVSSSAALPVVGLSSPTQAAGEEGGYGRGPTLARVSDVSTSSDDEHSGTYGGGSKTYEGVQSSGEGEAGLTALLHDLEQVAGAPP